MTAVVSEPAAADSRGWVMPGWNLAADLTPPELLAARQLKVLRRIIAVVLAVVVIGCAAFFVYAWEQSSSAADDATAAKNETHGLTVATAKYSGTTQLQAAAEQIRSQLASALQGDVDLGAFTAKVRQVLPPSMSIANVTITLTPVTAPVPGVASGPIGTVTVTGSATTLDDLPAFVDALGRVRGITDIVPTSNQRSGKAIQFTLSFSMSTALYSHHYDTGGK